MTLRKTTEQEKKVFSYLNDLRESGETNMFGAGPYIQKRFFLLPNDARKFLSTWMQCFNEDGNYDEIETD